MPGSDRCQLANSANGPAPASAQQQSSDPARRDDCYATHPSVSVNESNERFRHLGGLHRALGING